jgi:hypothetical protein
MSTLSQLNSEGKETPHNLDQVFEAVNLLSLSDFFVKNDAKAIIVGTARNYHDGCERLPRDLDIVLGVDGADAKLKKIVRKVVMQFSDLDVQIHTLPKECVPFWALFRMTPPKECRGNVSGAAFKALGIISGGRVHIGYTGLLRNDGTILTRDPATFLGALEDELGIELRDLTWCTETKQQCMASFVSVSERMGFDEESALAVYNKQIEKDLVRNNKRRETCLWLSMKRKKISRKV